MNAKYDTNRHSKHIRFACRGKHKEWEKQREEIKCLQCSKKYIAVSYEQNGKYWWSMQEVML
jgi:hypothetical protein